MLCQWCLCLPWCGARHSNRRSVTLHWFIRLQGIANLVGVTWLGSLLRDASIKAALASSSLGFVAGAMPFLQVQKAASSLRPCPRCNALLPLFRSCKTWFDRDADSHAWTHMLSSSLYGWQPVVCLQRACKAPMSIWSCCVQAYAVGFFAIPLVRWLRNKSRNAEIEQQNADRRQAAAMLVGCHCIAPPLT